MTLCVGHDNEEAQNIQNLKCHDINECWWKAGKDQIGERTVCDDVDNGLDNTCEAIRQETVLFSTPETDYIIYN